MINSHTSYSKFLKKLREKAEQPEENVVERKKALLSMRQEQMKQKPKEKNSLEFVENWFKAMKKYREEGQE